MESIYEILWIAAEVRIFPLMNVNAERSPYLDDVVKEFQQKSVEIRIVNYEF